MTYDIRALIESDLQYTLAGDYGKPIILISPDGETQSVRGQVLYDTNEFDAQTGAMIIYEKPNVSIRRSDLTRVPADGEMWAVKIPDSPAGTEANKTFLLERPVEGGRSIGFIRLYLTATEQTP